MKIKRVKNRFGKFYNEFGGFQIEDFFSFWICDFPVFAFRRYRDNHSDKDFTSYYISLIGITLRIEGDNYGKLY